MKRIQSLLILALGMLFISTSCSVEKRLHSTGYHIDWHNNNDRLQQKELIIKDKYKSIISTAASSTNSISKIKSPVFTSENQVFAKAAKEKKIQPSLEKIKALANTVKEETLLALQGRGAEQPDPKSSDADYDSFALTGFILAMSGVLALVFWPLAALLFILSIIFSAIGLSRIRENPKLRGRTLALTGLYVGIVFLSVIVIMALLILAFFAALFRLN